jgi:beta-mannosidase
MAKASDRAITLNGQWTLSYWKQPDKAVRSPEEMKTVQIRQISATVPGNVELDLLRAGLIKDPMTGNNINALRSWEGYEWCYSRKFTTPNLEEGQHLQLWFGGIDCLADVWVNGHHIDSPENMMIEHAFDITNVISRRGENTIQVIIRSATLEGQQHLLGTFSIGGFASEESSYIRKAPHTFGWDILPRLVSAGLWRNVELRILNPVRFRNLNYYVSQIDTASRNVQLFVDIQLSMPMDKFDHVRSRLTLSRHGKVVYILDKPVVAPAFRCQWNLQHADLWWPHGYGEPALYDAKAELIDEDGHVLATDTRRIGLRTVRLDLKEINLKDNPGRFCFIVNDEPIFVRGTNWVPLDALHSRDTVHLNRMMDMAADLNINMIRCWGGNIYEDHHFFDLCDKSGILVWQDFTMGCNFYPQRDDFAKAIEDEIQSVVIKFRNHPSLALWCGNNEDDLIAYQSLRHLHFDPNHDRISREVIPRVLYEFDPTRPYLPSSPYCSEMIYQHGGSEELLPENHLWGPRGYYKDAFYKDATAQFCSEIGYHGCPNVESLKKMFTKNCVYPWTKAFEWNDEWVTKSVRRFPVWGKMNDRNNLMINQIRLVFGNIPKHLDDFCFASQSVQAEAMKYFMEMWRGKKFDNKTGIIWWNLRDGWPLISDAIVDYYFSKKRAYYYLRNAERNICVFINDPEKGILPLMAANDTRHEAHGTVKVTDVESGKTIYQSNFIVPRNGKACLAKLPEPQGQGVYLIKYTVDGQEYGNHYLYGKAPYKLNDYRKWMKKTGLFKE